VLFQRYKDYQSILKITIKRSQTEMGLVFLVDYESCFFLLVATFLIITFPIFFAFFSYAYMDSTSSMLVFNGLLFQGIKRKKLRDVMVAYLI